MKYKLYDEEGWHAIVEVLKDTSTNEADEYTLKVIKTLRDGIFPSPAKGHIFDVYQVRQGAWGGMWHLRELEECLKSEHIAEFLAERAAMEAGEE